MTRRRSLRAWIGRRLAEYLSRPIHQHGIAPALPAEVLMASLRPGDVLLVEGKTRISAAIKYLSQSTWSHAALFVGPFGAPAAGPAPCLVEADIIEGVRGVTIDELAGHHTRICRPVGLSEDEIAVVTGYAKSRLGASYALDNVIDLARYLLPTPPVPTAFRRRMLALGSGDPTRAICSSLIAQAFQAVRYPILPVIHSDGAGSDDCPGCMKEILHIRHHKLFVPRDFDVSPYFQIVKPGIELAGRLRTVPVGGEEGV